MVSVIVRFKFAPEDRAEIAEILRQLAVASRTEPGINVFIPHYLQEDPDTVVIYEQYQDEKAVAAHRATEHFKKYVTAGLYQKMRDRSLESLVALV
ncbi:MAG TPA: putative quinol monooxygenase [Terracidiphilus sp.]|nr:putative quinol monooxygenase [Terracidiphilus sp.]